MDTITGTTPEAENYACDKQFATLAAQFSLCGHTLHRNSPADGPITYFAQCVGRVRHLPTLDDAQRFLAQIGVGK